MATTTSDVDLPEPGVKKSKFVAFRLDDDTQEMLDVLARGHAGNRSAALRALVRQNAVKIPPQERESAL